MASVITTTHQILHPFIRYIVFSDNATTSLLTQQRNAKTHRNRLSSQSLLPFPLLFPQPSILNPKPTTEPSSHATITTPHSQLLTPNSQLPTHHSLLPSLPFPCVRGISQRPDLHMSTHHLHTHLPVHEIGAAQNSPRVRHDASEREVFFATQTTRQNYDNVISDTDWSTCRSRNV